MSDYSHIVAMDMCFQYDIKSLRLIHGKVLKLNVLSGQRLDV